MHCFAARVSSLDPCWRRMACRVCPCTVKLECAFTNAGAFGPLRSTSDCSGLAASPRAGHTPTGVSRLSKQGSHQLHSPRHDQVLSNTRLASCNCVCACSAGRERDSGVLKPISSDAADSAPGCRGFGSTCPDRARTVRGDAATCAPRPCSALANCGLAKYHAARPVIQLLQLCLPKPAYAFLHCLHPYLHCWQLLLVIRHQARWVQVFSQTAHQLINLRSS